MTGSRTRPGEESGSGTAYAGSEGGRERGETIDLTVYQRPHGKRGWHLEVDSKIIATDASSGYDDVGLCCEMASIVVSGYYSAATRTIGPEAGLDQRAPTSLWSGGDEMTDSVRAERDQERDAQRSRLAAKVGSRDHELPEGAVVYAGTAATRKAARAMLLEAADGPEVLKVLESSPPPGDS